jgi:hypothetical protein
MAASPVREIQPVFVRTGKRTARAPARPERFHRNVQHGFTKRVNLAFQVMLHFAGLPPSILPRCPAFSSRHLPVAVQSRDWLMVSQDAALHHLADKPRRPPDPFRTRLRHGSARRFTNPVHVARHVDP